MSKKYTKEMIQYMQKLYADKVTYTNIVKRTEAEFGVKPSHGMIGYYVGGYRQKKRKLRRLKAVASPRPGGMNLCPAYCAFCGQKLKKGIF